MTQITIITDSDLITEAARLCGFQVESKSGTITHTVNKLPHNIATFPRSDELRAFIDELKRTKWENNENKP